MSVLKIRDKNGKFISIFTIKGDKGDKGDPGEIDQTLLDSKQDKFADISVDNEGSVTLTPSKNIQIAVTDDNGQVLLVGKHATLYADYVNLHGLVSILGSLDFGYGNGKISNLGTPTADTDAVNKGYVDTAVGDIESALDAIIAIQEQLIGGAV